jgi:hypothetical protein
MAWNSSVNTNNFNKIILNLAGNQGQKHGDFHGMVRRLTVAYEHFR